MDGILPLWKERGMTSHDCVFKLRKILQTKKVGHGGTLDPDVDGVLPICIGKGTKVIEFLSDVGKIYEGEISLGYSTTTEDASGERVDEIVLPRPFTSNEIDQAMEKLTGSIIQVPPMYSAVKVNGRRLYEYARNNEAVTRPKRTAQIDRFIRTSEPVWHSETGTQSWRFHVVCGKGTYIRTLAVDTGGLLGVPAHMSDLTRLSSGGFSKEQAVTLDQIRQAKSEGTVEDFVFPVEYAVKDFLHVDISDGLWRKVKNGMRLPYQEFGLSTMPKEPFVVFYHKKVVSIYQPHPSQSDMVKPLKVLQTE